MKSILGVSFLILLSMVNNKMAYASDISQTKGWIEDPGVGSVVQGSTTVRGWFLDMGGVSKLEVLMDGQLIGDATTGISRPDVENVYPEYKNSNSGFQYSLDTKKILNGLHTLTIKETGVNGDISNISRQITINNPVPRGWLEAPESGSTLVGLTTVRGWLEDVSGVSKIDVLVDGQLMGNATYGISRPDVNTSYPEYDNDNSGFDYTLDTKKLPNGQHTLTVKETAGNGGSYSMSRQITVNNPVTKGWVEAPDYGSSIKGSTKVQGWVEDVHGVSKIEVLVDGKSQGNATYGISRPDVNSVYPQYGNSNSGFEYNLDTKNLVNGSHTLTVRETGDDGEIYNMSRPITINNPIPRGWVENPSSDGFVYGQTKIRGWFLDCSGVAKIDVLVDGQLMGSATHGISRPDVQNAFPEYQDPNSGFEYTLNTTNLKDGQHLLTIRETGNNGAVNSINHPFYTKNSFPPIGNLETPKYNDSIRGSSTIQGWFLDQSVVSRIEVLVDGKFSGYAGYGISRPDVQAVYPQYGNLYSGFSYTLNTLNLSDGIHSLVVREFANNGSVNEMNSVFYVHNISQIFTTTNYNYSLSQMVSKQMNDNPQTDITVGYIREDAFGTLNNSVGTIQGTGWSVRTEPNKNGALIDSLNSGDQVEIISKTSTKDSDGYYWYEVKYNTGSWRSAYSNEVEYYANPNSVSKNSIEYFEFLKLSSSAGLDIDEVNEKILSGQGSLDGMAQYFIQAGETYHINELYLISHSMLETSHGTSELANGVRVKISRDSNGNIIYDSFGNTEVSVLEPSDPQYNSYDAIVYNMYGIGAVDSDVVHGGAKFAFNHKWFSPSSAITGGAEFVSENYIQKGQDTLYKMRWNPANPGGYPQYATDIGWAEKQTYEIVKLYGLLDMYTQTFDVPVFN